MKQDQSLICFSLACFHSAAGMFGREDMSAIMSNASVRLERALRTDGQCVFRDIVSDCKNDAAADSRVSCRQVWRAEG
jgi:hypothetical protein